MGSGGFSDGTTGGEAQPMTWEFQFCGCSASAIFNWTSNSVRSLSSSASPLFAFLPPSAAAATTLHGLMISSRDTELYRTHGASLSAADRENMLKSYLPDPSALRTRKKTTTGRKSSKNKKKRRTKPIRTFLKSQLHLLLYTVIHIVFGVYIRLQQSYRAVVDRVLAILFYHHRTPELIQKDVRGLSRIPQHLSVVLTLRKEDDALEALMDEVAELAAWSACAGIPALSIYEKSGMSCLSHRNQQKHADRKANGHRHPEILHPDPLPDRHQQTFLLLRLPLAPAHPAHLRPPPQRLLPPAGARGEKVEPGHADDAAPVRPGRPGDPRRPDQDAGGDVAERQTLARRHQHGADRRRDQRDHLAAVAVHSSSCQR